MKILILPMVLLSLLSCDKSESIDSTDIATEIIESKVVPQEFRHLIPIVQEWGIGDDSIRSKYEEKATPSEKQALYGAVNPYRSQINSWLDTYTNSLPDEAAMFMYALLAMEEMGI